MAAEFEKTNQYIWNRYIDLAKTYGQVDEDAAIHQFEDFYAKHAINEDEDCFYFGVLLYEVSFRCDDDPERRIRYLKKAKEIFDLYREVTGETDWDVIEDRLEDINSVLAEEGIEVEAPGVGGPPRTVEGEPGMVLVPSGKFLFGAHREEKVLGAYLIDVHPVTNAAYAEFVEATAYRKPATWDDQRYNKPEQPVVGVSWMDALKFCEWRGKQLPTEEQWEKAARGTDGRTYPWGEDLDPTKTNYLHNGGEGELEAIDSHDANVSPFGCKDAVGYVWEWTSTSDTEEIDHRVVKGGSWADIAEDPEFLSCWARTRAPIKEKNELLGFRCCKPVH